MPRLSRLSRWTMTDNLQEWRDSRALTNPRHAPVFNLGQAEHIRLHVRDDLGEVLQFCPVAPGVQRIQPLGV